MLAQYIDLSLLYSYNYISISFWSIAIFVSSLWGMDGIREEYLKNEKDKWIYFKSGNQKNKWIYLKFFSYFISDFVSGFIGLCALYLLLARLLISEIGNFDIFLGIVAIAGISGYGYKLPNWLNKSQK